MRDIHFHAQLTQTSLLTKHRPRINRTPVVREGKFSEGAKLLQTYSATRLNTLHSAEAKLEKAGKQVQAKAIETLNQNGAPAEFYTKYKAASEAVQTEMVSDFIRQRVRDSKEFATALADVEAATPVVSVMLSLGIAQLNLAQAATDEHARKKGLEEAEASFLSVEKSASGSDEYRLFLGQVSYWLGKHDEGRKLFEEFMTSKGESAEKRLMVASVLRQVGALDESRSISEKAFEIAKNDEQRQSAAALRGITFVDNDDRILWLERAGNRKDVQIALMEARANKKLNDGDRRSAEELFRNALAGYAELPKSAAVLNNSANVFFSLYLLTKDPKDFREAVNRHEESSRIESRDTVLMHNLVEDWTTLLMIEAVEHMEGVDMKRLPASAITVVAHARHKNAEEEKRLMEQYQASSTFRKARAACEQLMVLAPKDPRSFASLQSLAQLVDDIGTLKSLRERAAKLKFEQAAQWNEAQKLWRGEKDADMRKSLHAALAEWTEALKALPEKGNTPGRVACRSIIRNLQVSLGRYGETFDSKASLAEAEALAVEQPSYGNLRIAQDARLAAMVEELATKNEAFAALSKPLLRYISSRDILILAMERKLLSKDIGNNAHFKAWMAWRGKIRTAYPEKGGATNWALLRYIDPALAEEERIVAVKNESVLLDIELDWLLNPTNPESIVAMAWQEQMFNHPERASEIFKKSIARGMPLPQPL